jgi:galactokinase
VRVFAPGRVNLIGEHTDHSGGLVLPIAIQLGVTLEGEPGGDAIRLRSAAFEGAVELTLDGEPLGALPGWGRYVAAAVRLLVERGPVGGFDGEIGSTVPIGAGLSSSAALTVAVSVALAPGTGPLELAHVCQEAEHRAVGVPVGLMDPAASLLGRRGHAVLLDCETEEYRHVPLPSELAIVVLDSGTRRSLEHSGYAERRAELERGLAAFPGRRPLDLPLEEVEAADLDDVARRRLRHVVTENQRVRRFVVALERDDPAALGPLLRASHESLRDDYEVSTPALDALAERAEQAGALGARMMGGGFGGAVVALADADRAADVAAVAEASYVCEAVDGAHALEASWQDARS